MVNKFNFINKSILPQIQPNIKKESLCLCYILFIFMTNVFLGSSLVAIAIYTSYTIIISFHIKCELFYYLYLDFNHTYLTYSYNM